MSPVPPPPPGAPVPSGRPGFPSAPPTLPPPAPPGTTVTGVHQPAAVDDREPQKRPKAMFWDRIKVLVLIAVFLGLSAAYKRSQFEGLMSLGEAVEDQLRAKWWIVALAGLEVLRQIHYLIAERSTWWYRSWDDRVFGRWERRMARLNPWLRYRMGRFVKIVIAFTVIALLLGWKWGVPVWDAIAMAPGRLWENAFATGQGMPLAIYIFFIASISLFQLFFFYAIFFVGGIDTYKPGEIKTRFRDVWGQDPVLRRVKETTDFLEKPEAIEAKGGYVPNGILLWGPPGTGKTLMAEAVAGETGKPYVFVDPSAFIQTFMGVAPMKIKWLYRKLRKLSLKHGGVVVFFDEADALGNRGALGAPRQAAARSWAETHSCNACSYVSDTAVAQLWSAHLDTHVAGHGAGGAKRGIIMGNMGGGGAGSGALQALLTEMSGLKKPRGFFSRRIRSFLGIKPKQPPRYRMLHIFATNMPNALDEALLRPGRIDRQYKVGYPHLEGRTRTFEGYLAKVRHDLTPAQISRLSLITPGATGAIVKDIVNEALIVAMREGRETITWLDMVKAKHNKTHGEADDWTYGDLERHQVAIHEACHAAAMYLLQKRATIDVATIERRGDVGGFVAPVPLEERFGQWRSEREIDVMTFLASLAGERLFFDGDNSGGVGGDLRSSTAMVTSMLAFAGMGDTIASRSVTIGGLRGVTEVSEDGTDRQLFETDFGKQVEAKLQELLARVGKLLADNRWFVLAIAHALETHLTITGEDIDAIYRGTPGPTLHGWTYHTDDFRLSYEAYHLSALAAHQGQRKPDIGLPVLVGDGRRTGGTFGMPDPWSQGHRYLPPPPPPGV
jgi:cell division protease FtsH